MSFRDKATAALLERFPIEEAKQDSTHLFSYKDYNDNLFCRLGDAALTAYGNGSGGEIKKMVSIASSSALTFNLLGNGSIVIPKGCAVSSDVIPAGEYTVEYEKKLYPLRRSPELAAAHPDAFLSCQPARTAIFCEMKMFEWLDPLDPKDRQLSDSYLDESAYFQLADGSSSGGSFRRLIERMTIEKKDRSLVSQFTVYDAWQMLKHTLAIYSYTSKATQQSVNLNQKRGGPSLAGQFQHIFLLNVVNEMPAEWITDSRVRTQYSEQLQEERKQADEFRSIMMESDLPALFKKECDADFHMAVISAKEFSRLFTISGVPAEQLEQLKRARAERLKRYFD